MPRLVKMRLAEIISVLDKSLFSSAAFTLTTEDDEKKIVTVTFNENLNYRATLYYVTLGTGQRAMRALVNPGNFTENDIFSVESFSVYLKLVEDWTERLKSEVLLVNAFEKQFSDFQAEINQKLDEHFSDPDLHFTKAEREELFERLRKFDERFAAAEENDASTKREFEELRSVMADLAQAAHSLSKRTWYRTAASKLYVLSGRALTSKPGQQILTSVIHRLLDAPNSSGADHDPTT